MIKQKKIIVISGVNLSEGGPLTVITSVLNFLNQSKYVENYKIYALVHSKDMFNTLKNIEFLEFPEIKKSWTKRLKFEYIDSLKISKNLNSFLWFSLHDITPNVISNRRIVYCHNPSPFYKQKWSSFFKQPLRFLYTKYYKKLYRININKNDYVVVQQKWIKDKFIEFYDLPKEKIIVSLPNEDDGCNLIVKENLAKSGVFQFFFPAFPRNFKNFEIICKAAEILNKRSITNFEILLTIDGTENNYASNLVSRFSHIMNIKFIGLQPKRVVEAYYNKIDALIFPSKLETWGLPISEFKKYHKPMLVSDLPYAYETVGNYDKVKYFNPDNEFELADNMNKLINGDIVFTNKGKILYENPVCSNWEELFQYFIK